MNETPYPDDLLFIEKSIYDYELWQEYALCCDRLGKHDEAARACGWQSSQIRTFRELFATQEGRCRLSARVLEVPQGKS